MAINLASKFSSTIASVFTGSSYLGGRTAEFFDFTGVKGLKIYTPVTVPLVDYTRDGANRYGLPSEMQDTVQELVMTQDKGFALTIDKGNDAEQMNVKAAGQMLNLQIAERVVPEVDRYALSVFLRDAGTVAGADVRPSKAGIMAEIARAAQTLDDALVPQEDRYLFVSSEVYGMIRLAPEFMRADALAEQAVGKGTVGAVFGAQVVKLPLSYLPAGCYFLLWHRSSVLCPTKLGDAKIHTDPPGISGSLLEGRWLYDAFVLGARSAGVYALVDSGGILSAPTLTESGGNVAVTGDGAEKMRYTVDGTDPRYSHSAQTYTAPLRVSDWGSGTHAVKAVAYADGKFTSAVRELKVTVG